jgi:Xaa-Pro aminopeptidase
MKLSEHHLRFTAPSRDINARLTALRSRMGDADIAVAWIEHQVDRLYFTGSAQDGVLIVPADGPPVFHVRKSVERAREESPLTVEPYPGRKAMAAELARLAGNKGRIGLAFDVAPAATYAWLQETIDGVTLVDVAPIIRTLRAIKSPWEIDQIRRAAQQVAMLFSEVGSHIKPDLSELDLTGVVEGSLRALGHGGTLRVRRPGADLAIATVVSGTSARYPTAFNGPVGSEGPHHATASGAGWRKLVAGETVMLDLVTTHNGYHADTTRTFFLGESIPDEIRAAHDFCREILGEIENRLKPGASCSEIYLEVAEIAKNKGEPEGFMGYGENRVRFFGHGVGLELDELPVLAEKIDMRLEPGMVLAIEPKAFLDPHGPVGVENTYVITEPGHRNLCDFDDDVRPV